MKDPNEVSIETAQNICLPFPWMLFPLLSAKSVDCWLRKQRKLIGWTYSFSLEMLKTYTFTQLIANRGDCEISKAPCKIRLAGNIHAKCYITEKEAYIGSFNLTKPTIEDLGVIITDESQVSKLREIFNLHWRTLK